jgi:hypothetical protein
MGTNLVGENEQAEGGQRREIPGGGSSFPVWRPTPGADRAKGSPEIGPIEIEPRGMMKYRRPTDIVAQPGFRPATRNERAGKEGVVH